MKTERPLQQYIIAKAHEAGCLCDKLMSQSRRGWPDLIVMHSSFDPVFVEVKSPSGTGKLSVVQESVIADIRAAGGRVAVIDSKTGADELINSFKHKSRGWVT